MTKGKTNNLVAALKLQAKGAETGPAGGAGQPEQRPRKGSTAREGMVMVSGWLPIEARSSFKLIQAKHPERKMQDLVVEAIQDLFAKYNVPQAAKGN